MKINRLQKRLTLLKPVKVSDGYAGYESDWQEVITVWAAPVKNRFSQTKEYGTEESLNTVHMKIRPRPDVRKGWRAIVNGEKFIIDAVDRAYRDNAVLILRRYEAGV